MGPAEGTGGRSPLQAAREPLSLRFLVAFSASTVLTAAVAVPMAFQAHLARDQEPAAADRTPIVMGTTTVPTTPDAPGAGLVALVGDGERSALHGAELSGEFGLALELDGVSRVDFVLDDGPVVTDRDEPWTPVDGDPATPVELEAGAHELTATITFDDGRVDVRSATFTVAAD
jgi:hypothetical protein